MLTVIHVRHTPLDWKTTAADIRLPHLNHQVADSVMAARYVLTVKPDLKTVAGANEDYAWGRDSGMISKPRYRA